MNAVKVHMESKISEILQKRLKGENLSKVARDLGISKSLLADWVAARRLPSLKNIKAITKLADYLGLTLEQLLVGAAKDVKIISAVTFEDDNRSYRINIERIK